MSILSTIEADIAGLFNTNPIGEAIKSDAQLALAELEKVTVSDLEAVVKQIGLAVLSSLVTSGVGTSASAAAAIAAGIAAAEAGFRGVAADVTTKTLSTLATTVVNQVSALPLPAANTASA